MIKFHRQFDPRTIKPDYPQPFMVLGSFVVSPDYFAAFRIPIRRGRAFTAEDRAGAPAVAIVNRAMSKSSGPIRTRWASRSRWDAAGGPRRPSSPWSV